MPRPKKRNVPPKNPATWYQACAWGEVIKHDALRSTAHTVFLKGGLKIPIVTKSWQCFLKETDAWTWIRGQALAALVKADVALQTAERHYRKIAAKADEVERKANDT